MRKILLLCALWISMSAPSDATVQITNNTSQELKDELTFFRVTSDGSGSGFPIPFSHSRKISTFTSAPGETVEARPYSTRHVVDRVQQAKRENRTRYDFFLEIVGRPNCKFKVSDPQDIQNMRLVVSETGCTLDTPLSLTPPPPLSDEHIRQGAQLLKELHNQLGYPPSIGKKITALMTLQLDGKQLTENQAMSILSTLGMD